MDTPADEDEKPSSSTANDAPIDAGMTSKSSSMTEVPSDCPMDQNDNAKPQEAVDVVPDKEPPSTSEHLTEQMKLTEKTRVGSDVPVIASDVAASAYEPPALSSDKDLAVENDSGDRASIEVVPAKEDSGDHNFIHQVIQLPDYSQIAGSSKDRMEWEASEEPEPAQTETPVDISELDGGDEAEEDGEQQLEEEQEKKTAEDLDDAALAEELLSANSMEGKALVLNAYDRVRKVQKPVSEETLAQVNTRAMMTELCCPICLDLLTETMTTKECLHRFCQECITMALLRGNKECPTCRKKLVSKRSLRADPKFDRLIALIFPDRSNFRKMQQSDVQLKVFKKTVKKRPWSHLIKLLQKTEKKREILRTRDEVRRASRSQSPVNLDDYELDSEDSDDTIPANNSTEDEEEDVDEDNEEDVEEDEQITASAEKSSTENAPEEDTLGRNVSRIRDKSSREKTQSPKPGTSKISTRSQSPKPGPSKMADYAPPSPRQGPSSAADNDSQIALEDSKSKRKMTIAQLEKLINGAPPAPGDEDETPDLEEYDDWGDDVEIVEDVNFSDGGEGDGDDEADDDDEVISVRFMRLPKKKTPPMESVEGTAPKKNTTKGKSKSRSQTPHSDSNETVFSICNSSEYEEVEEECEEDEEEEEAEELPEDEYDVNLEEGQEPAEGEYFEETEDQYDETCEDVDGDEFPEVAGEFDGLEEKFEDIHREEERAFAKEMEELDNIMDAVVEIKKEADGTEVVLQNEAVAEPALDKQNDENMDEGVVIVANFAVVRPPCSDIDVDYAMEGKSKDGIMPAKGLAPESKTANENKDEEKPEYMEGFSSLHLDKSIEQGHVATTGKTEGGSNDDNLEDDVEARKGSAMEQKQGNAIDKYHDAAKERDEEKSNEMIQKEAQKRSSYVDGSDEKKSDDVKFEIPAEGTAENPIDVVLEAMSNGESDSEYEDEDDEEIENLERKLRRNKEDFSALGATGEEPADKEAPVENTEDGEESDVTYDELDFMTEKELDEQWDNVREAIIEDPDGLLTELDKRRLENPDEETDLDRSVSTDVSTGASSLATSTTSSILDIPKDVMALYEKRKKEREEAEAKAAADAAAEAAAEAVASREREREAAVQEANQALQSQAQQAQAQFNAQLQAQMQSQQVQQAQQVADIQRLQHLLPTLLAAGLSPALVRDAFSGLHPNIVQQSLAAAAGMAMQAQAAATGQAQSAAANQAQAANQVQQVPRPPPTPTQTIGKNNVQMSIVQPAQPLHQLAPQLPQSRNAALNQIHMVKNEPMDSFASPSRPASSMNMGPGRDARPPSVIGIHGSPYGAVVGAAGPSGSIQIMGPNAAGPGPVGMHHPFAVPGARPPSAMPPPMRTPNHPGQPNPFAHLASAQQGGLTQGSPRVPPSPALQPQQQQQQMPNQPQYQQPRSPLPPASLKMLPPALQHMAQRNILTYQASMVQQAQQAQAQQAQQLPPQQQQQPSFSMPISAPNAGQPMQFQMPNVPAEELTPEMLQHLQNAMAHAKAQAQFHAQAQAQAHSQALARAQAQHGQPDQTPAQQAQAAQAQQQAAQAQVQQAQAAQAQAQHVQAQAQAAQAQAAQAQGQSQGQGRPPQNQQQLNQHLLAMMNPQIIQQFNASQIQAGANPAALAQQQVAAQQILMQTVGHLTPMLQPQLQQMMLNSQKAMQQGIPMPPPNSSQPSASRKRSPGPAVGNPPAKTPKSSKKGRPSHQQQQAAQQQAHQQAMQQAQQHHAQQQANLQAQQQAQQQFQQQAQQQVHQHVQQALQQAHQQAQQAQLRVQMQAQQQQQHAQLQQMQAHQHAQIQAQLQAHQHAQLQTQQHAQRVQQQPPQQQKRQGQQAQTQLQVQQQGQQKAQQPASQPAPAIQPMPATAQGQAQQRINPFAMPLPAHLLHGFPQEMVSQPTMMQIVQSGPQPSVQDLIAAAKPPGRPPVSATPQTGQQAQQQQAPPDRPDNAAPIQSLDFMQLHILQQVLQQQQAARLEQARQQVILQQRPHHQPDQGPNGMSQELNIVPRPVNVTPGPNFGMQQLIDTSENRVLPPPNSASSALATAAYLQSQLGYPPETQERIPLSPAPVTRGPATVETGPSVIQSSASITHEEMQLPRMETPKPLSYYLNRTVKTATSVPTTSTAATTNAGAPKQSPPEELSKPSTSQEVSVVTTTSANPAITTTQPTMAPMFVAPSPALGIAPPPPSLRLSPQPSTSAIAPPTAASNPEERLVNWLADHPSSPLQVEDSMEKELERRTEETEAADPPIKNPEEVINKKGESSEADLQIEAELMPTALLIKREVPPEMLTPRYIRAKAETTMGHLSSMLQLRAMEEASINSSDFDSDPVPNVPEPQHFYVINKEGGLHVKKIFLHESILAAQSAATRNEYLTIFYDSEPPAPNEKKSLLEQVIPENFLR